VSSLSRQRNCRRSSGRSGRLFHRRRQRQHDEGGGGRRSDLDRPDNRTGKRPEESLDRLRLLAPPGLGDHHYRRHSQPSRRESCCVKFLSENVSEIPKYVGNCFICLKMCRKLFYLSENVSEIPKFVRNAENCIKRSRSVRKA
jgi:hypothetical protein